MAVWLALGEIARLVVFDQHWRSRGRGGHRSGQLKAAAGASLVW